MRYFIVCFVCLLAISNQAFAAACYTSSQAEAEQGIKIQSELMVIGLNCSHKHRPGERNLYSQYHAFVNRHKNVFSGYENTMLAYYNRNGGNANQSLIDLRTNFANKISSEAAGMRPDVFCWHYADRVSKATGMNEGQLRSWASTIFPSHPPTKPLCQ